MKINMYKEICLLKRTPAEFQYAFVSFLNIIVSRKQRLRPHNVIPTVATEQKSVEITFTFKGSAHRIVVVAPRYSR